MVFVYDDDDTDDDDDTYQLVRISWCHYWRGLLGTNHLTEVPIGGGTLTWNYDFDQI